MRDHSFLTALIAGAALGLTFRVDGLGLLVLPAVATLFWLLYPSRSGMRQGMLLAWCFIFSAMLTPLEGVAVSSFPGYVALVALQACFFMPLVPIFRWTTGFRPVLRCLILASAWVGIETLAGMPFLGPLANPTLHLAYSQTSSPILALSALSGFSTVTFVLVLASALLAELSTTRRTRLDLSLPVLVGSLLLPIPTQSRVPGSTVGALHLAAVQQPLPRSIYSSSVYGYYPLNQAIVQYKNAVAALPRESIVLLPETFIPGLVYPSNTVKALPDILEGRTALLGVRREENGQYYNSVLHVDGFNVQVIRDKVHLVPFIERQFSRPRTDSLSVIDLGARRVATLICWENLFHGAFRQVLRQSGLVDAVVVLSSNYFAGQTATPRVHARASSFLAASLRVPVIHVSSPGPTVFFDARGWTVNALRQGTAGSLQLTVAARPQADTMYARFGDQLGLIGIITLVALSLWQGTLAVMRRGPGRRSAPAQVS